MMTIASKEMQRHDMFNIVVLSLIVCVDLVYLTLATDLSELGTDELGADYEGLSDVLLISFTVYLLVDLVWVILVPKCVPSNPVGIIIHHIACLVLISLPWMNRQFAWHTAINLLVEVNTLLLTLRRNVLIKSTAYHVFNVLFYATWIILRLVLYPMLVVFFYWEYIRYSVAISNYYNMLILASALEAFITAMGFKWTYDMVAKQFFSASNAGSSTSRSKKLP